MKGNVEMKKKLKGGCENFEMSRVVLRVFPGPITEMSLAYKSKTELGRLTYFIKCLRSLADVAYLKKTLQNRNAGNQNR